MKTKDISGIEVAYPGNQKHDKYMIDY